MPFLVPHWMTVFLAALTHHTLFFSAKHSGRRVHNSEGDVRTAQRFFAIRAWWTLELLMPVVLLRGLSTASDGGVEVAYLLRPMVLFLREWPRLFSWIAGGINEGSAIRTILLRVAKGGASGGASAWGPLGRGHAKIVEAVCVWWLLTLSDEDDEEISSSSSSRWWPRALWWGDLPSATAVAGVAALSVVVNVVLSLWSSATRSRGDHSGVNAFGDATVGRPLRFDERVRVLVWAVSNAVCEEWVSRGFFHHRLSRSSSSSFVRARSRLVANGAQALAFGVWHWRGVPSGVVGVVLTTIYGAIMGLLREYRADGSERTGLLLPVVAHSAADYFIFSVIVRKQDLTDGTAAKKD